MPDQPISNASRITAILQDLADVKSKQGTTPPVNLPVRPMTPTTPPINQPRPVVNNPPPANQPKPIAPIPTVKQAPQQTPAKPAAPTTPIAPTGVVVPPKPTVPPPPAPVKPAHPPIQATPTIPRPLTPPISRPSTPVVPPKAVPANPPTSPKPVQSYTSELRTMKADIGQISTGQAPAGTPTKLATPPPTPSTPDQSVQPSPTPSSSPQIVIPSEDSASSRGIKKGVYIGIIVIIVLVSGAYYLYLSDSSSTEKVINSISPSPSESSALLGKALSVYFSQTSPQTADLKADQSAQDDFLSVFGSTQPTTQQALRVPVTGPFISSLGEFLSGIGLSVPLDLKASLATDWVALSYGQSEQFDAQGQIIAGAVVKPRLVMVSALQDVTAASQAMHNWEINGLANAILDLAGFDKEKVSNPIFSSGSYKQIDVRYQNYPYADQSIDYAIVLASNGRNYLIISTSRESIFYAIDQLVQ